MIESVSADILATGDDASLHAQSLGVGANLEGHPALQTEVRDDATALAEDALAVAVVDEHHRIVIVCELGNLVKQRDVAVHAEHAVGDD